MATAIDTLRPAWVVIENVRGLLSTTAQHGSAYPLPPSARPTPDTGSSSSPTALLRTPLATDPARGNETLQQVNARHGTVALSHQIIDLVTRPRQTPEATAALIADFFANGSWDSTPAG